jgi:hypothetical protein
MASDRGDFPDHSAVVRHGQSDPKKTSAKSRCYLAGAPKKPNVRVISFRRPENVEWKASGRQVGQFMMPRSATAGMRFAACVLRDALSARAARFL